MKLPKGKVERCVSDDPSRLAFTECHLIVRNKAEFQQGDLVATDGKILAIVPVDLHPDDTAGQVSLDAIALARKTEKAWKHASPSVASSMLRLNGEAIITEPRTGAETKTPRALHPELSYPDVDAVTPDPADEKFTHVVYLNANLLSKLAQAISEDGEIVALFFDFAGPEHKR